LIAIVAAMVLGCYSIVTSEMRGHKTGTTGRRAAGAIGWIAVAAVVLLLAVGIGWGLFGSGGGSPSQGTAGTATTSSAAAASVGSHRDLKNLL